MKYNHNSIARIYNPLTDLISFCQTVKTKEYLIEIIGRNQSVLDVGCGNGDVAISCAGKGSNVIGLDLSKKMITNARKHAKERGIINVKFTQEDFFSFETNEKFDYVISSYFLNVFPDEQSVEIVLKKMKSHLKPGGHLLIVDESEPKNAVLSLLVHVFRVPVFSFFKITTGITPHKIHDLVKILRKLDVQVMEEKRFLFQYCSVIIGKVEK